MKKLPYWLKGMILGAIIILPIFIALIDPFPVGPPGFLELSVGLIVGFLIIPCLFLDWFLCPGLADDYYCLFFAIVFWILLFGLIGHFYGKRRERRIKQGKKARGLWEIFVYFIIILVVLTLLRFVISLIF